MRADLNRQPGTAFVVASQQGTIYLITSAHVVEGDSNPRIEFVAAPQRQYASTVRNLQPRDTHGLHGLAFLVVNDPPAGATVLQPSSLEAKQEDAVVVAGYPAPIGELTVTDTSIGGFSDGALVLNYETGTGYSGGPVLRGSTVVGLVFGTEGHFGLAVPTAEIRAYAEAQGVLWGSHDHSGPSDEEIKEALRRLGAAYGTELVPEVRKEWLSMTKQQESSLKRVFSDLRAVAVEYDACGTAEISPSRDATIVCTEQLSYTQENHRKALEPLKVSLTLKSVSGVWRVDSKSPVK